MNEVKVVCVCGVESVVLMVGNNTADGKKLCYCGRHITVHLRKNVPQNHREELAQQTTNTQRLAEAAQKRVLCL